VWEKFRDLLGNLLTPIQLLNFNDEWRCHYSTGGMLSVFSLYRYLSGSIIPSISSNSDFLRDLRYSWKSFAPSKIIVFSWQLFRQRLPTMENLTKCGIFDNGPSTKCVWCVQRFRKLRVTFSVGANLPRQYGIRF
jgi:hypothetical protein